MPQISCSCLATPDLQLLPGYSSYPAPSLLLAAPDQPASSRELAEIKEFTDSLQQQFASGMYTHHQKSVVADSPDPQAHDGRRKLVMSTLFS